MARFSSGSSVEKRRSPSMAGEGRRLFSRLPGSQESCRRSPRKKENPEGRIGGAGLGGTSTASVFPLVSAVSDEADGDLVAPRRRGSGQFVVLVDASTSRLGLSLEVGWAVSGLFVGCFVFHLYAS